MTLLRILWIVLGTLSLCIGIIGIAVPGLPTTPFLLLAAGLYVKSSDKLYQKLIHNRFVGPYILEFQTKKGMTLRTKLFAISSMWIMITISIVFLITPPSIRVFVGLIGVIGTFVMGFAVPTRK